MEIDSIDKSLLNLAQSDFPLTERPFYDLSLRLGITESEVLSRILDMKSKRLIRQIGPVLDARKLGYHSTLAAMRIEPGSLAAAGRIIAEHPAISHGYERDHDFNVWITFSAAPGHEIESEIQSLAHDMKAAAFISLPAIRMFKLNAYFDMTGSGKAEVMHPKNGTGEPVALSTAEKMVINEIQQDLPVVPQPFSAMAARSGMDVTAFLDCCRSLRERGVIRRFGAALNHRHAGFTSNAMCCWIAPAEKVEEAGRKLAALSEVSHCYERRTDSHWPYNLFAMVHSQTEQACREIAGRFSEDTGLTGRVMLFSTREFKKMRVTYRV